ncbi:MAG: quinone-dependent dihydroorotate dehydrogenase [Methylovulum sp.]|nr:quinone-dependent dihydroorotate dehydrogenase [Methylovulum sp.]MCF7998032.1 quinone-dependent dihydroorotate dehydrogenase [Methylovulum sp.]
MNLYPMLRPLLFSLEPETAHEVTLKLLNLAHRSGLARLVNSKVMDCPVDVMGLSFKNPVGLAAGMDKNGDYIDALAEIGFGFIELGTITPRPQPGNPKPRLFRLPEYNAVINRMGFNNKGIEHLLAQVARSRSPGIIGINIGKNFDTPIAEASKDYVLGMQKAYPFASYITLNISSPNTQNLRQLQQGDDIKNLLDSLKHVHTQLHQEHGKYVPLVLKIAPDLTDEELLHIAKLLIEFGIDGVIATNTTIARDNIAGHPYASEMGGLSGEPVKVQATSIVRGLAAELNGKVPIIAAGGIMSAEDAQEKIAAGASLVQVYSGLIYSGTELVSQIVSRLKS